MLNRILCAGPEKGAEEFKVFSTIKKQYLGHPTPFRTKQRHFLHPRAGVTTCQAHLLDPQDKTDFEWPHIFSVFGAILLTRRKILVAFLLGLIPLASCAAPRIIEGGLTPYNPVGSALLEPAGRVWIPIEAPITGGQSGILPINNGDGFWMVSDRGTLTELQADRADDGQLEQLKLVRNYDLRIGHPDANVAQMTNDAEDLAYGPDGAIYVSFEGYGQVARLGADHVTRENLVNPDAFVRAQGNRLFEALARLPDGSFIAIPEERPQHLKLFAFGSAPRDDSSIPVVHIHPDRRLESGYATLTSGGWIPMSDGWAISAADTADDGSVWVLERAIGFTGFSSRIRRFSLTADGLPDWENGQVMLETRPGDLGNMEGMALWRPAPDAPLHITLVSDNDNSSFRTTLVAEYIWPDAP
ncbi:esterase-like activity of phytase family protein [Donghicola eburneus]|uniref:esterase-like activity of phytase family protein n=1 Tax=Donghicola eburneus TaxID=393278 RepID=UPI001FE819C2|nr:esterase-like activity of phytase family protein [Donghicola eburneus]